MIYLKTNTINEVFLTLYEKSVIIQSGGTPYYLFEFYNQSNRTYKYFFPQVLSSNSRFDLVKIIVSGSTSENLTAGTVSLNSGTHYDYRIYEKSNMNLFVGSNDKLLEQGICTVSGTTSTLFNTYTGSTNNFNIYYNS